MRTNVLITAGISALTAVVGAGAGYMFARTKFEQLYRDVADLEIVQMREYYQNHYSVIQENAIKDAIPVIEVMEFVREDVTPVDDVPEQVFEVLKDYSGGDLKYTEARYTDYSNAKITSTTPTEDDEVATEPIDPDAPYVISYEVFTAAESGYEQYTCTWFEGDNILVDETDSIVRSVNSVVGAANLQRFGDQSEDPNIVYIRNPRIKWELEVLRDHSTYAETVAGLASPTGG